MLAHSDSWHDRKHKRCGKPSFWSCQAQHSLFIIETPHFPPTKNAYIKGLFACIVDEYGDRIFVMRLLVCFRPDRESWSLGKQPTFFQSFPIGIKQEEQVIRNFIMSRSAQWKSLLFGYLHCHLHWHKQLSHFYLCKSTTAVTSLSPSSTKSGWTKRLVMKYWHHPLLNTFHKYMHMTGVEDSHIPFASGSCFKF